MTQKPGEPKATVMQKIETTHKAVETVSTAISIGSGILGFIRSIGGFGQFLVEVGALGFAWYAAVFIFGMPVVLLMNWLDKATHRSTTDTTMLWIAAGAVLIGGLILRFAAFDEGFTRDLDAIGSGFLGLLGVAVLLAPLAVWWYYRGSKPAKA